MCVCVRVYHVPTTIILSILYNGRSLYTNPLKRPRDAPPSPPTPPPTIIAKPTERFAIAYTCVEHAIPPHAFLPSYLETSATNDVARADTEGETCSFVVAARSLWWLNQRQTTLAGPIAEKGGGVAGNRTP